VRSRRELRSRTTFAILDRGERVLEGEQRGVGRLYREIHRRVKHYALSDGLTEVRQHGAKLCGGEWLNLALVYREKVSRLKRNLGRLNGGGDV
jgi:hypothetical protein